MPLAPRQSIFTLLPEYWRKSADCKHLLFILSVSLGQSGAVQHAVQFSVLHTLPLVPTNRCLPPILGVSSAPPCQMDNIKCIFCAACHRCKNEPTKPTCQAAPSDARWRRLESKSLGKSVWWVQGAMCNLGYKPFASGTAYKRFPTQTCLYLNDFIPSF